MAVEGIAAMNRANAKNEPPEPPSGPYLRLVK
jgi:hypothetical protein